MTRKTKKNRRKSRKKRGGAGFNDQTDICNDISYIETLREQIITFIANYTFGVCRPPIDLEFNTKHDIMAAIDTYNLLVTQFKAEYETPARIFDRLLIDNYSFMEKLYKSNFNSNSFQPCQMWWLTQDNLCTSLGSSRHPQISGDILKFFREDNRQKQLKSALIAIAKPLEKYVEKKRKTSPNSSPFVAKRRKTGGNTKKRKKKTRGTRTYS